MEKKRTGGDLGVLVARLRAEAAELPSETRADVLAAVEQLERQLESDKPTRARMDFWLKALETVAKLSPTVNAISQALSNMGV